MISLETLGFLQSPVAQPVLHDLQAQRISEKDTLPILTRLRKSFTPEQAGALLELAWLRQKAVLKFGDDASKMFFTADAIEQASDPRIRHYRTGQVSGRVLDVCCSIGTDSLAFAKAGQTVLGLDIDPIRIEMARMNASILNVDDNATFAVADVLQGVPPDYDALFFDPARRNDDGKRMFHVEQYQPPLSTLKNWQAQRILVKLSPGVNLQEVADYKGVVEFISVDGDLKEAVLQIGNDWRGHVATLLDETGSHSWCKITHDDQLPFSLAEPQGWLYEPDPSILRAGLVRDLAIEFGLTFLDETIAYVCGATQVETHWMRSWQILDWMPFHVKKLRAYLRERQVGQVTVKKRGSPMMPEELIAQLKPKGDNACTIVLTRLKGEPIMVVCAPYSA